MDSSVDNLENTDQTFREEVLSVTSQARVLPLMVLFTLSAPLSQQRYGLVPGGNGKAP